MKRTYIIIPALEPESGLCRQIRELQEKIPSQVVVIDDGSGRDYREIFDRIEKMAGCIVLHHGENRGKGQALKTGFRYVRESVGKACRVLCLDCDGQHLPQDGVRLLRTAEKHPDTLVLGVRDFSGKEVPWKSRLGNRISSVLFRVFSGIYLADTQTGFRAFDGMLLDQMLEIPGDRFEYETRVLFACAEQGIPVRTEKIETVYLNENAGTHFRPVQDSLRVTGALFGGSEFYSEQELGFPERSEGKKAEKRPLPVLGKKEGSCPVPDSVCRNYCSVCFFSICSLRIFSHKTDRGKASL